MKQKGGEKKVWEGKGRRINQKKENLSEGERKRTDVRHSAGTPQIQRKKRESSGVHGTLQKREGDKTGTWKKRG